MEQPDEAEGSSVTAEELRSGGAGGGMTIFGGGSGGPGAIEFVGVVKELALAVAGKWLQLVCRRNAHPTGAWPAHSVRSRTQTIIPP